MICETCGNEFYKDWRKDPKQRKKPLRFCGRSCSNSRKWTINDKLKKSISAVNSIKVNKVINEKNTETNIGRIRLNKTVIGYCKICGNEIKKSLYAKKKRIYCSKDCDIADSKRRKGICGGYREKSGTVYSGYFYDIYCNSTWEMWYVAYCKFLKKDIKRNNKGFYYSCNKNIIRKYYPDFIVDNVLVEIKGGQDKLWPFKKESVPFNLIVLGKNEIKEVIKFCKSNGINIPKITKNKSYL